MKKYNVKTLAEIAVLCIFCNNIQVWSMNGKGDMGFNEEDNPNLYKKKLWGKKMERSLKKMERSLKKSEESFKKSEESFKKSEESFKKSGINFKNKLELLFFNKEGNLSLCCFFNYFNGNMGNHGLLKLRKMKKRKIRYSENIESSQKSELPDNNNFVYRPVRNEQIITLNVNNKFQDNNDNDKKSTNGEPNFVANPQVIISNTIDSNPYIENKM